MKFEINIPDQVVSEDPTMLDYLQALQAMTDRMSVSHFKYGPVRDKYPDSASAIDSLNKRLVMYRESGNTENCLDAANFAVIERVRPSHPKAHFRAQDSHESPGLVWK